MKYENTLFWRYDPAALVPVARDASGEERGALSEILRCLPREVGQIRSRFDGATDAGTALMNGSLALTRHLNNLLNSWYLGATLPDSVSGLVERKLVGFIHAPTLSYGKEVEGLRTLLTAHAAAGDSAWQEFTDMVATTLPMECGLYKLAAKTIGETLADMPELQEEYLQNMVALQVRGNVLPSVSVLEFLSATVPLRNDTTGHNLGFTSAGAAVVARYLAPALRAFLTHPPVRAALTGVRVGVVVRWSNATNVYVELDSEELAGPGEGFDLNARNATLKVDARVVVRLAADVEHPGVSRASFAALFVEFPKPAGDPVEADRKVAAEVLAYLLRDGVPPPASDALKPLDGTGWIPSGRAEQDVFVERASKAVVRAYTRWVLEAEAGKPPNPDDLSPDRDLLARADPELAALPTEALVGGLVARLTAGRDARRKIVARVLAERAVTVEEIGRILLDPTLTLRTLREMQNQHELSSDMPWPDEPDPEAVAAGHFSVWLVRAELPGIYQRVASLKHPGGLNPGSPTRWSSVELLIKAFRDLVETTVTERDFPPSRHYEPDVGKYGLLAMLDDWLTTKPTVGAPPIAQNPPTVSPANPPVVVEPATELPPPAPPPLPLGIPVSPSEAGLRLTVGGESLRASGITALYRELTRAFATHPNLLTSFAALAGPGALFATNRSLFYSADQLAEGVQIRQPVRLDLGGSSLYFEGSIPPELGLLHLARLLQMSGMPAVSASMDGAPIPEARLPGPAEDGGTAAGGDLLLRFPDPQRVIRVVKGDTVAEFLLDLVGEVLEIPEALQELDGLLPIENGTGPGVRRHVLARTPFHKDGTPFRAPVEVRHAQAGVLYLETHLSTAAAIDGARVLLQRFGIQGAATGDIPTDAPRPPPATQPSPPPS